MAESSGESFSQISEDGKSVFGLDVKVTQLTIDSSASSRWVMTMEIDNYEPIFLSLDLTTEKLGGSVSLLPNKALIDGKKQPPHLIEGHLSVTLNSIVDPSPGFECAAGYAPGLTSIAG